MSFQDRLRIWLKTPIDSAAKIIGRFLSPNAITLLGTALVCIVAVVIALGYFQLAAMLLIVSVLFDVMDGAVARQKKLTSTFGAILDSSMDRIADGALLAGLVVFYSRYQNSVMVTICLLTMIFSFTVSYIRARAAEEGLNAKVGWFDRPARIALLIVGLIFPYILWIIIICIMAGAIWTSCARLLAAHEQASKKK